MNDRYDSECESLRERPELDFSKGVRGKHYARAMAARNVVVLDVDLLDAYPDSEAVNAALRSLKELAQRAADPSTPAT